MANDRLYTLSLKEWVRGLAALVLLFDIYTVYQHLQLQRMRHRLAERDRLFQLISENAADMIAVVGMDGRRIFNSISYQKVLGYLPEELLASSAFEQIHPDDRARVSASEDALRSGTGKTLEYRFQKKDGVWLVLESSSSVIRNEKGQPEKLLIVNRDITERRRAEESLRRSEAHFRSAVEDAEPLRKLAQIFLEEGGFHVLSASSGEDALEVAARHPLPLDLLLTDVVMPGMNGRVLAEQLLPRHPGMKVLYMSGYTDSFIAGHGVLGEGIQLLHKPFTEDVLIRKVREVLDGRKKTPSSASANRVFELAGRDLPSRQ